MFVDVAAEIGAAVLDPGGEISDVDRQLTGQVYDRVLATDDRPVDALPIPARHVGEHFFGEVQRPRQADAAMAEGTVDLLEQAARRRVMQIDVEAIGEDEFDLAERVLRPGPLAD